MITSPDHSFTWLPAGSPVDMVIPSGRAARTTDVPTGSVASTVARNRPASVSTTTSAPS